MDPLVADAFGWTSALAGLVLFRKRYLFLRQRAAVQGAWAVGLWVVHLAAFAGLVAVMALM